MRFFVRTGTKQPLQTDTVYLILRECRENYK